MKNHTEAYVLFHVCVCGKKIAHCIIHVLTVWSGKCQCLTTSARETKTSGLELIPGAEVQMYTMCFHGYTSM